MRCSSSFVHLVLAISSAARAIIRELYMHLPLIMSQCCGFVLSWVALRMFCSCLIAQFILPVLLQCTTQRDVLECRFAQQQSVSQRAVMLLEMHSGAISFVTTLFRAHQLFDYFLCSLQWRQLHVKLLNFLNDCDTVEFGAYMCALATTSFIASDAELPFGTWRHGWFALRTLHLQYR